MGNYWKSQTFRLFLSRPSFRKGLARSVDIGNTLDTYASVNPGSEADEKALQGDWEAVGDDLRVAFRHYEQRAGRQTR